MMRHDIQRPGQTIEFFAPIPMVDPVNPDLDNPPLGEALDIPLPPESPSQDALVKEPASSFSALKAVVRKLGGNSIWGYREAQQITPGPEGRINDHFPEIVDGLVLPDLAVVSKTRDDIRDLDKFRLIPLIPNYNALNHPSMDPIGYDVKLPRNVTCNYELSHRPYLDTRNALGLVYDDRLIAVAGAGIRRYDQTLLIKQIQDVSGVTKLLATKKEFYSTGLHNGMDWRQTLVRGWEQIAVDLGLNKIAIQGHKNSHWSAVQDNGYAAYDGVAAAMGYIPKSNNWTKKLK